MSDLCFNNVFNVFSNLYSSMSGEQALWKSSRELLCSSTAYIEQYNIYIMKPIYFLRYEEHMNVIGILIYDKYPVATATRTLNDNIKRPKSFASSNTCLLQIQCTAGLDTHSITQYTYLLNVPEQSHLGPNLLIP